MVSKMLKNLVRTLQITRFDINRATVNSYRALSSELSTLPNTESKHNEEKGVGLQNHVTEIGPTKCERKSVLEECQEDITHIAPYLQPSFNFAAYVNKSETLQQLVKMGVNLDTIEKIKEAPEFVLCLKFDENIKPYILFLHDLGLSVETIANIFTKNPFILKEDLDNLQVRINYLQHKRFTKSMILRILEKNVFFLTHSTQSIDNKLGFLKKSFGLTAPELRQLVTKKPKMITYSEAQIKKNIFVVVEEMGFTPEELKKIVLKCPVIFMKNEDFLRRTFEFVHQQMNITLETIAEHPGVLTCRKQRIKQRHLFLTKVGRAQYDPKQPNYVSLEALVSGSDSHFCTEVAKSSVQLYNTFVEAM